MKGSPRPSLPIMGGTGLSISFCTHLLLLVLRPPASSASTSSVLTASGTQRTSESSMTECCCGLLTPLPLGTGSSPISPSSRNRGPEIGQTCGAPPVVQFGDITEIIQKTYQSGSSVVYKCANFYKLEGKQVITCKDGEWEKEPVCRVPCTVKETDLQQNNIQFKFKQEEDKNKKLYSEHADYMLFECRPGYQISDNNLLRIQCLDGVLKYPRCLKEEIGQTCGAPPVVQFGDITEIIKKTYQSGSSVVYKCANFYKLEGKQVITCKDGEWEKEPVCRVPCTVKETDMQQNNIQFQFKREEDKNKKLYSEHADYMLFECRPGYQISDKNLLRIQCLDGVLKYPRCLKEEEAAV